MTVSIEQTVATLRKRAAAAREALEAKAKIVRASLIEALAQASLPGADAWLIGSLAWGDFGERSDVDLVLRGVSEETARRFADLLTRRLQVTVEVLRFEALPAPFRDRILREGVRLRVG